jgi:hypothetical protein
MNDGPSLPSDQYADVGTRISRAVSLYARYPLTIIVISAANVPFTIAGLVVPGPVGPLLLIPSLLVQEIVRGALILVFFQALTGQTPSVHGGFTAATNKLGALIEYFLRVAGASVLLVITIIGIPWALRLFVRWLFGSEAIMLQNASAKDAISESCRLVTGNWWRTFGNLLLFWFLIGAPGLLLRFVIRGVAGGLVASFFGVLTAPIFAGAFTLFYLRLRYEKGQIPPSSAAMIS